MSETPPNYTWMFVWGGRVRHLVTGGSLSRAPVCTSRFGPFTQFVGTGSQREYERCASLPPCQACVQVVPAAADWEVSTR